MYCGASPRPEIIYPEVGSLLPETHCEESVGLHGAGGIELAEAEEFPLGKGPDLLCSGGVPFPAGHGNFAGGSRAGTEGLL